MKNFLLAFLMVFAFLVCDMPTTGEKPTMYHIVWTTPLHADSSVQAETSGIYGFKFDVTGMTSPLSGTVKACNTLGCSVETFFGPPDKSGSIKVITP